LLFGVGGRVYGCDIARVREIIPARTPTRLPGAPACVTGLINLRGTVVTVVDLGLQLGGEAVDRAAGSIVLVEHGARVAGVAVDDVRDVQPFDPADVDPLAAPESAGGFVRGVVRGALGAVVVLDVQAMLNQVLLSQGED